MSDVSVGYLRRDEDGHWYLVPVDQVADFDELMQLMEGKQYLEAEETFCEFIRRFDDMRVDGYREVKCLLPD